MNSIFKAAKPYNSRHSLEVETLEDRMMLSTVSIFASGETGQEQIELFIDGQGVCLFNVTSTDTPQEFIFPTEGTLTPDRVRIAFVNDLYEPGVVDRNVNIEKITIAGQDFFTSDASVFSTGTWDSDAQAIVSGFGKGPTLHANGYFQFANVATNEISFGGRDWNVVSGTATSENLSVDEASERLSISGINGEIAISTEIDIVPGEIHELSYDAVRQVIDGEFSFDSRPWATVGINYYDANGQQVGQNQAEVNHTDELFVKKEFRVPESATTAYLWIWVEGFEKGDNIPLEIGDISFEQVSFGDDTTAPTAELPEFSLSEPSGVVSFTIDFSDDSRLSQIPTDVITVTDPGGLVMDHYIATGFNTTNTFQTLLFEFPRPGGGEFGPSDNGEYTVTLNENKLRDEAGNFAAGQVLGTLTLDITPLSPDTEAPTVVLRPVSPITAPPTGQPLDVDTIFIEFDDNREVVQNSPDRILVEGPNGYSKFAISSGGDVIAEDNLVGFVEYYDLRAPDDGVWGVDDNGTYTVSLIEGTVTDNSGNVTPGGPLGTFEVNISPA